MKMKQRRYFIYLIPVLFLAALVVGCKPRIDTMAHIEKMFIKMVDKSAGKLYLNADQKAKLDQLKMDIHKNFGEGSKEKKEAFVKIKEEGMKENPDVGRMTALFQGSIRDESRRINRAFDLLLNFQGNLNESQRKKLAHVISEKVKKWD
jgi:hypothetical protein